jgi:hypothetical protein
LWVECFRPVDRFRRWRRCVALCFSFPFATGAGTTGAAAGALSVVVTGAAAGALSAIVTGPFAAVIGPFAVVVVVVLVVGATSTT